jgi:hypothetical protein
MPTPAPRRPSARLLIDILTTCPTYAAPAADRAPPGPSTLTAPALVIGGRVDHHQIAPDERTGETFQNSVMRNTLVKTVSHLNLKNFVLCVFAVEITLSVTGSSAPITTTEV